MHRTSWLPTSRPAHIPPPMRHFALAVLVAAGACAPPSYVPAASFPFPADTVANREVSPGVIHRYIWSPKGPWAIHALDVDLSRCYSAIAAKGGGAVGRRKTSDILAEVGRTREVVGGVNADFFSLAGLLGVPTGGFISEGRVIVGPYTQPVFAIDSNGTPRTVVLRSNGSITKGLEVRRIDGWNRPFAAGLSVYDANWGAALDTATGVVEVVVEGSNPARVIRVDTTHAGAPVPANGQVIVAGRTARAEIKGWLRALEPGDTVRIAQMIAPFHPREAVGGRPILARDSAVAPEVETEGQVSFRNRNPRTAVGIGNGGKRLLLVVIDGRRPGYSAGTTLRETADIMLALGARDAINLDGGGSSALVYRDPTTKSLRVANRPSDPTGERAVGNALAIAKGC